MVIYVDVVEGSNNVCHLLDLFKGYLTTSKFKYFLTDLYHNILIRLNKFQSGEWNRSKITLHRLYRSLCLQLSEILHKMMYMLKMK